jgi:rod shape-determining protein MreB and related proteins
LLLIQDPMFKFLFKKMSKDVAIDLGTSNTLVFIKDRGVVVNEASIVAINSRTGQILEVGREAVKMLGKTPPHIEISQPLVDGVISDFEVTEKMLKFFLHKVHKENSMIVSRPRVVIGIPLDVTEVEKKAVEDAVVSAGGKEVFLVENVMASAVGARLPIQDASGNMIVDLGGGITQIAVISLSGVVAWKSLSASGNSLDQEIVNYMRTEHNLLIGMKNAEKIKIDISNTKDIKDDTKFKIRGRDLINGLPREVEVSARQIINSMDRTLKLIVDGIKSTLEITPPELISDIYQKGIVLVGGGAMLKKIDEIIAKFIKIPVRKVDDPLTCSVRGMGIMVEDFNLLKEVAIPSTHEIDKVR